MPDVYGSTMSDNPYATPQAALVEDNRLPSKLAGRWSRLFAFLIDEFLLIFLTLALWYITGLWELATNRETFVLALAFDGVSYSLFGLLNLYLLKQYGQTIGKRLLSIRIADMQGEVPSVTRSYLLRVFPLVVLMAVPNEVFMVLVLLLDSLMIFRKDKRCAHDWIAGTQVLKA